MVSGPNSALIFIVICWKSFEFIEDLKEIVTTLEYWIFSHRREPQISVVHPVSQTFQPVISSHTKKSNRNKSRETQSLQTCVNLGQLGSTWVNLGNSGQLGSSREFQKFFGAPWGSSRDNNFVCQFSSGQLQFFLGRLVTSWKIWLKIPENPLKIPENPWNP